MKSRLSLFSAVGLVLVLITTTLVAPASASSPVGQSSLVVPATPTTWGQFGFNSSHDARSLLRAPTVGDLAWARDGAIGHSVTSSAVQSLGGTLWFSDWRGLSAYSPNGTPIGSFVAPRVFPNPRDHYVAITGTPAILRNQVVVVGDSDGRLWGINPNLTVAWRSPVLSGTVTQRAVGTATVTTSNRVYVTSASQELFALTDHGVLLWNFSIHGTDSSAPTVAPDGTVYVGSSNDHVYAVAPNGSEEWAFATGGGISSSIALSPTGLLLIGSQNGWLYALNPNGTLAWKFGTSGSIEGSPAISINGTVYVGSRDGHLYAIYPNGVLAWEFSASKAVLSSPAVDAVGNVYFGDDGGKVYGLTPSGSQLWTVAVGASVRSQPTVGIGSTLYVSDVEGFLYEFVTPVVTSIHFHEVGLPNGTAWSVQLANASATGATTSLTFVVPEHEAQGFTIPVVGCGSGCRFSAVTSSGVLTVLASPVNVTVVFVKQYQIELVLVAGGSASPPGVFWETANTNFAVVAPPDSPYGFVNWTSSTPLLTINHPLSAVIQVFAGAPGVLRAHYT